MKLDNIIQLKNIHTGKIGIVAGSGTSIRNIDPAILKNHILIAVNSSIMKFQNADYFFTCDPASRLYHSWQVLKNLTCKIIICLPNEREGFGHYDSVIGEKYNAGFDPQRFFNVYRRQNHLNLQFTKEDTELIFGLSSTHCAVHLAYLMGCDPIVIIGCDCRLIDNKRYFYDYPGFECLKDYIEPQYVNNIWTPPVEKSFIFGSFHSYWEKIKSSNSWLNIINSSDVDLKNYSKKRIEEVLNYAK